MRSRRAGFTLVELLVVITIIAILIGLLMPAVESVRESGRRTQCMNSVKQMAMACLNHESKNGFYPTGGWGWTYAGDPNLGFTRRQPGGWHFNILPFMGLDTLHDMGLVNPYTGTQDEAAGRTRAATPVSIYICPTRHHVQAFPRYHGTAFVNLNDNSQASPPEPWGRSDYGANSGDGDTDVNPSQGPNSNGHYDPSVPGTDFCSPPATGVMYRTSMCTTAMIKDGTSKTYLLGERYLDPDYYYTYSLCSNDQGWDQGYDYDTDRWTASPPVRDRAGYVDNGGCDTIFGSAHPATFNMAFCDGSVHPISYSIDPGVHKSLGNRMDGGPGSLTGILTPN
jgi:prepilin-type N-terminal cleavage/methylation domain-containing protein/prepilin-type processing-associated H-X9-DG protein